MALSVLSTEECPIFLFVVLCFVSQYLLSVLRSVSWWVGEESDRFVFFSFFIGQSLSSSCFLCSFLCSFWSLSIFVVFGEKTCLVRTMRFAPWSHSFHTQLRTWRRREGAGGGGREREKRLRSRGEVCFRVRYRTTIWLCFLLHIIKSVTRFGRSENERTSFLARICLLFLLRVFWWVFWELEKPRQRCENRHDDVVSVRHSLL